MTAHSQASPPPSPSAAEQAAHREGFLAGLLFTAAGAVLAARRLWRLWRSFRRHDKRGMPLGLFLFIVLLGVPLVIAGILVLCGIPILTSILIGIGGLIVLLAALVVGLYFSGKKADATE